MEESIVRVLPEEEGGSGMTSGKIDLEEAKARRQKERKAREVMSCSIQTPQMAERSATSGTANMIVADITVVDYMYVNFALGATRRTPARANLPETRQEERRRITSENRRGWRGLLLQLRQTVKTGANNWSFERFTCSPVNSGQLY